MGTALLEIVPGQKEPAAVPPYALEESALIAAAIVLLIFSFLIPTQNLGKNPGKNFLLRTHHCQGPEELNKLLHLIN